MKARPTQCALESRSGRHSLRTSGGDAAASAGASSSDGTSVCGVMKMRFASGSRHDQPPPPPPPPCTVVLVRTEEKLGVRDASTANL